MKLPLVIVLPACLTQAADPATTASEPGLEIEHEVSVGKNPVPFTFTDNPGEAVPRLNVILGPRVTLKMAVAKSPALGVQPVLPGQPVTSTTY
jgi:hypothetical protein